MLTNIHDEYPRDGQITARAEYERIAPTNTVGRLKAALKRVRERDQNLPADFASYIRARVPSLRHLDELPDDLGIDERGRLVG